MQIDLNYLYAYINSNKKNHLVTEQDYLTTQAFIKETRQNWADYYSALFAQRIDDWGYEEDEKLYNIDLFMLAIDRLGYTVDDFLKALKKNPPLEKNTVDKFLYNLSPGNRMFSAFNEIRKRGNTAYFPSVEFIENSNETKQSYKAKDLFYKPVLLIEEDFIRKALFNMLTENGENKEYFNLLPTAIVDCLMTPFYLENNNKITSLKNYKCLKDAPQNVKDKFNTNLRGLANIIGENDIELLCEQRDTLFDEYYNNDFMFLCDWPCDDNFLNGLVKIGKTGKVKYDLSNKDAIMNPTAEIVNHFKNKKQEERTAVKRSETPIAKNGTLSITKQQCEDFSKKIIGQDFAVNEVIDKLISVACGFVSENRPIASFLFNGATGVGKTETAKAIANVFFDNKMFTVDMSTFKHPSDVARLTGSPPGYVGYNDNLGFLSYVQQNPSCVLLFDEIDKCHPSCLTFLLSVLDEGKFASAKGEVIDLSNCVIVATTNQQASIDSKSENFRLNELTSRSGVEGGPFVKEFLGRFDNVIEYRNLSTKDFKEILKMKLDSKIDTFEKQQKENNIKLGYSDELLDDILLDANSKITGARALNGSVQKLFIRPISRYIIENGEIKNSKITVKSKSEMLVNDKKVATDTGECAGSSVGSNAEISYYL